MDHFLMEEAIDTVDPEWRNKIAAANPKGTILERLRVAPAFPKRLLPWPTSNEWFQSGKLWDREPKYKLGPIMEKYVNKILAMENDIIDVRK